MSLIFVDTNNDALNVVNTLRSHVLQNPGVLRQILVIMPAFSQRVGIMVYYHRGRAIYAITSNLETIVPSAFEKWNNLISSELNTREIIGNFSSDSTDVILNTICELLESGGTQ